MENEACLACHLDAGQFWNVFRDGVVEIEAAFLVKHHHSRRNDRLGHRVDPEDGVLSHGRAGIDVLPAVGFQMHDLALAKDQGDGTGKLLFVDHVPNDRFDLPQLG